MRISDKKRSAQLLRLRFASIVIGVALTIASIGLVLLKQQNADSTEKGAKEVNQSTAVRSTPTASASPTKSLESIDTSKLAYNITTSPQFTQSKQLEKIVNRVVDLAKEKNLPTQPLSITLIDIKTGKTAGYQQEKFRYPASVVKLFWMVYLYAQIEKEILSEADFTQYLDEMIKKSDNDSASYIVDKISHTEYQENIQGEESRNWKKKRLQVNQYFQQAGYDNINVSQKTFPISSPNLSQPEGSELILRENRENLIRNQISTQQVARLLYEIYKKQSVSSNSSKKMAKWLTIDAQKRNIKKDDENSDEFNPVRGFLSASLPNDVDFKGKAGLTSNSRNDAGIITTPDGKTYILVVFADDEAYASDWDLFPEISRLALNSMIKRE
ncbi:serine hydrolase [Calothrix sp. CCY 0018]|uniref:serine hydrolase n=1 Tax=Calothrix sp. CCY 0018 TaxID=3103864 RepID=UPI0039C66460